ncbi:uncharacterized protein LOC126811691 [Patella vulgata]|uniref:uncharacterized protein LOC126811691 n=1 Tax=Patella vulgata TaxID=6465 RepID=UPI0021800DBC|nr:uncharacterized protein LOC126811691 [Patella vulgata]
MDVYDNYTYTYGNEYNDYNEQRDDTTTVFITIELILTVLIVIFNGVLILAILLNQDLRSKSKFLLILTLSISDLLVGLIIQPSIAYFHYELSTSMDCNVPLLYAREIALTFETSIAILLVGAIGVDWITEIAVPSYTDKARYRFAAFMTSSICIGTVVILSLLIFPNLQTNRHFCVYTFEFPYNIIIPNATVLPQSLFVFITTVLVIVTRRRATRSPNIPEIPCDIIMASVITLICILSLTVYSFILLMETKYASLIFYYIISRIEASRRAILPLVWLINRYSRKEMIRSLTEIIRCKNSANMNIEMSENITNENK